MSEATATELSGDVGLGRDSLGRIGKPLVSVVTIVHNRPDPLAATIENILGQTYGNIEHIVIDGASTDSTVDVIRRYEDRLAFWVSEPDEGIYDAINKGIARCTGDFVMLLHAADTYDIDYIERLVSAAALNPGAIIYSAHRHGAQAVEMGEMSEGIFLHHLGINHLTFLVPRSVYELVGPYDDGLRIASDVIWIAEAYRKGVTFVPIEGHGLSFAEGGLSSASSPTHRDLVVGEAVIGIRRFFPFLPADVAEAVYLYRFNDGHAQKLLPYLSTMEHVSTDGLERFRAALRRFLPHVWAKRAIDVREAPDAFGLRWSLAVLLGVGLERTNLRCGPTELSSIITSINGLKARLGDKKVTLHYLEVFSRPSETFVPDLIRRQDESDGDAHVILCDRRELAVERPFGLVFAFDYVKFNPAFARRVLEYFLDTMKPAGFVFHFATNGWRLLSRVSVRFREVPAVYMTHGIDVFDLYKTSPRTDFILKVAAKLPNVRFTAVSSYLRNALVSAGVSHGRVTVVHNVAHDRFFAHRKPGRLKTELGASPYAARIVNIGRLIRLKGQADLVRAIGLLRRSGLETHLTLVYGKESGDIDHVRQVIASEGVTDLVAFRPYVDFDREPDYLNNFDLLVSASTYTEGQGARSETFGMSILEGIAAGLPVVVTDAGGQPEVAGPPNAYVGVARHGDPESIAAEIRAIIKGGGLTGDNIEVARERLAHFSAERQSTLLSDVTAETRARRLSPLLISTGLNHGAGGAAQGVHRSLLTAGVQSHMVFRNLIEGWGDIPGVEPLRDTPRLMGDHVHPTGWFLRKGHTIFSIDTDGISQAQLERLVENADIINLHWYARFLSHENIAWLTNCGKPVVFTIRDMNPLTGGCHFFHGCDNWRNDCLPCPQFRPADVPLPHVQFDYKRLNWNFDNIAVVTLSDHTRRIVEQSPLFGGCRIQTIPNPVDFTVFHPIEQETARRTFELPADRKIIAYLPSFDSDIKGAAEFQKMLKRLARDIDPKDVLVICAGRQRVAIEAPFEIRQLGHISGKDKLAAFFSAADVTVIPSLEETFSNTAAESIACGTPVAGFATGAIPTLAQGGRGQTAPVGDVVALAAAVCDILRRTETPRAENHAYMLANHAPEKVGAAYSKFFAELIEKPRAARRPPVTPAVPNAMIQYLAKRLTAEQKARPAAASPAGRPAAASPAPSGAGGETWAACDRLKEGVQIDLAQVFKSAGEVSITPQGILLPAQAKGGHRLYGPNARLEAGRYTLELDIEAAWKDRVAARLRRSRAIAEIVWNVDEVLDREVFQLRRFGNGRFTWRTDFVIDETRARNVDAGFELRIWTDGRLPWRVTRTILRSGGR